MRYFEKLKCCLASVVLLIFLLPVTLLAEDDDPAVAEWESLDEEFRQAMMDEISARRGLATSPASADELIRSADDIREALQVSCDISGACPSEPLLAFPEYDEQQGRENAEKILRQKAGSPP